MQLSLRRQQIINENGNGIRTAREIYACSATPKSSLGCQPNPIVSVDPLVASETSTFSKGYNGAPVVQALGTMLSLEIRSLESGPVTKKAKIFLRGVLRGLRACNESQRGAH